MEKVALEKNLRSKVDSGVGDDDESSSETLKVEIEDIQGEVGTFAREEQSKADELSTWLKTMMREKNMFLALTEIGTYLSYYVKLLSGTSS